QREDQFAGTRELRSDGRGQAESHGTQSSGIEPQAWMVEANELRRPHLVLADVARHDGFAAGDPVDFRNQVLRLDFVRRDFGFERMLALPLFDLAPPGLAR